MDSQDDDDDGQIAAPANTSPRCLCTLEPLAIEGYAAIAQRKLSGGRRKFPHRIEKTRNDLITYRGKVIERMSISGVQDKVSVRLARGKLELVDRSGEYLLKPVPVHSLPRFTPDLPANEHLTMLIAERIFGIETAVSACIRLADDELAYICKRFDREGGSKISQEDFCQLTNRSPDTHGKNFKYDGSYEELGQSLKKYCGAYRLEIERLFKRIMFCYAFSNGDAHLKNFSLFRTPSTGDYVLTPAYDLVSTSVHIPDETRLALDLFADDFQTDEFERNGFHTAACFLTLAERFEIAAPRARTLLAPFASGPQASVEDLIQRSFLSEDARAEYLAHYRDRCKALRRPWPSGRR